MNQIDYSRRVDAGVEATSNGLHFALKLGRLYFYFGIAIFQHLFCLDVFDFTNPYIVLLDFRLFPIRLTITWDDWEEDLSDLSL